MFHPSRCERGLTETTSTYSTAPSPAYLEQVSANNVDGNKPLELNLDHQISEINICPSGWYYILQLDEGFVFAESINKGIALFLLIG
ncbi:hypothetical protein TNIN_306251 [Trichonephila inaurata madagascariensis]|uniref:Uncharacterized protein n=1 Tax=Trichonephila inaurata madagascariensis TaxID=2747483 RepID=A0A8X6WUE8_9ARAC|nr:hypothetical protein TNIN_306251 [Trichonephila inaurata madagascariensis]